MPIGPQPGGGGDGDGDSYALGTVNTVSKFTSVGVLGDSRMTDDNSDVVINSGAGIFEVGDSGMIGNGVTITLNDAANSITLETDRATDPQRIILNGTSNSIELSATGNGTKLEILDDTQTVRLTAALVLPATTGVMDLGSSSLGLKQAFFDATITAAGTTGAQTINKSAGSVNFGIGATSLVVTCDKCTANSIVLAIPATNDATGRLISVVPGNGSFTINVVAPAAEMRVNFWVLN